MAKLTEQQKARILAGTLGRGVLARELNIGESAARKMIELVKEEDRLAKAKQPSNGVTEAMRKEILEGKLGRTVLAKRLNIKESEARKIIEAIRGNVAPATKAAPVAKPAVVAPKAAPVVPKKEDTHLGARFHEADKRADERDAKIVELYTTGEYKSQKTVASLVGCSESTVGEVLKRKGVKARRPGSPAVAPVETPKELKWFASTKFINIMADGKTYTADSSHEQFRKALDLCIAGDVLKALGLINVAKGVSSYAKGQLKVENDVVTYKGLEIGGSVVKRIISNMHDGKPFGHLVAFLEKLLLNPNKKAIEGLFDFLEHNDIEITTDGFVHAYRRCTTDYKDFYTGKLSNKVGETVKLDRAKCDSSDATCSAGLHVAARHYIPNYHGGQGRILLVQVDPQHVVAVPKDYKGAKMRCCEFKVLKDITKEFGKH
ncbi:membrane integrity protector [Aeromonas phage phiAS5]|uniref:Membrane integrity protector n=1 Tax=Aeromonas phage phiAS5 TaxID=879630 RepID=E1A2M5_9CAUD|nr:RIIB lysis inhibitor [Aeromonas phage phiAS5]ADM79971.1 membrane integrity protector [Aeromonas phage phiAS5]BES53257.1 hypothetical protein [Aeromonas phage phiWae14]